MGNDTNVSCKGQVRCYCVADGRGFQVLGAVVWGPLCGGLHWGSNKLQVGTVFQKLLANQGLRDLPQEYYTQAAVAEGNAQLPLAAAAGGAAAAAAAEPPAVQPRRLEDLTEREKRQAVEAIKRRELAQLHERLKREEEEAKQTLGKTTLHQKAPIEKRKRTS